MSSAIARGTATLDDLYRVEGKAELIGGAIVHLTATGLWPGDISYNICTSLKAYARLRGQGRGTPDGVAYYVPELPSGRQSFSPDAAYFAGALPEKWMRFVNGTPTFAVEVRSENDYGPAQEREMAAKRADYFASGTLAVWDVDTNAEVVYHYRPDAPDRPVTFRRGDMADAEPALPGWQMAVDDIFAVT